MTVSDDLYTCILTVRWKSDCAVVRITGAVLQALIPVVNEVRDELASLKRDSASLKECLNETMSQLREDLEEHKNRTTSELADLQTSFQFSIDNPPTEMISDAVLQKILPYMNDIEENLFTDLSSNTDGLVSSLRGDLEMYKNWTTSELADLQTSLQVSVNTTHSNTKQLAQLSVKMDNTDSKIVSLNTRMINEFRSSKEKINGLLNPLNSKLTSVNAISTLMRDDLSCVKTDLSSLNDSMNRVCDKVEEHEDHMTAELMELNEYLKENLTHQISSNDNPGEYTCGGTRGWRRVVYLNMTDPNTDCPSGLRETGYSKRTCGIYIASGDLCDSVTFPVSGGEYSQVCGRIKAYQWGQTSGFWGYNVFGRNTIDDAYFSGVVVTHGSPRQHIWTFAVGQAENSTGSNQCPCDTTRTYILTPPFVGEDYFCESGYTYPGYYDQESQYTLHSNDTLWDGRDCHSSSTCCSRHNHPFFTKTLSTPTNDDIELRRCGCLASGEKGCLENVAIELIELYVKENHIEPQLLELDQRMKQSFAHQINNINTLGVHTCGGTGGWRRAVYLDMTDPSMDCPSGWRETGYSKRTCGRLSVGYTTCDSVTFPVSGGEYSQVCGRIKAYQWGRTIGFYGYSRGYNTIDGPYFSGVAVMHGSPRQHIWTFAAGAWENGTSYRVCPCDTNHTTFIPPFVGEDYLCESGYVWPGYHHRPSIYRLHSNDTLWDGRDCHSSSTCCSFHNPPYFTKPLNTSTTDDIELRMCHYFNHRYENVAVELIEMYVK